MKFSLTYNHFSARYSVHSTDCTAGKKTSKQTAWEFEGTLDQAVEELKSIEREKGGSEDWINDNKNIRVCSCCKGAK